MDTDIFDRICERYGLGTPECPPTALTGGFLHKMYSMFTESGKYAVKLLNPYIMQRDTAMENYRIAEELERRLELGGIPILPALTFDGTKMQEMDGQYFYLFDWYDGKALKSEEIRASHCETVGGLLARIHGLDRREETCEREDMLIDWDSYISRLAEKNGELYRLMKDSRTLLYECQAARNEAVKKLPPIVSICHNDMDSKNVLWNGLDCRIIDLECLSYSSPVMETYELALCWSGYEICSIDFKLFERFIGAYKRAGGRLEVDAETLYECNHGRLEWLEYNVKRALGIECSEEEIEVGVSEVRDTMTHVVYYHDVKKDIIHCLNDMK